MPRLPDGTEYTTDSRGNVSYPNGSAPALASPTFAGSTILNSPGGGNSFVAPSFVDFSGLEPAYVSFQQSLDRAHAEGDRNRGIYYGELFGDDSKNAALRLVDTDIEGINRGLSAFIPRIRSEGDIDTQTNINRAGRIDEFNYSRLPTINQFNRSQTALNNQYAREEFNTSIEGSGLDYRDRILGTVGRLEQRARGELPGELATQLNKDLANRGSEILKGSGVSSVSRAGINANDRLTISERLNLALGADSQLPGVLTASQQLLTAPFERNPTAYAQPTQVPLNVANVADRIPIQSNISAGNAQLGIAGQATELQTISPSNILGSSLSTEQFNESSRYARDLGVLDREQSQLTATDNAVRGAINADKADVIRDQAYAAYQQGLGVREQSDFLNALGGSGGILQAGASLFGLGSGGSGSGGGLGGIAQTGLGLAGQAVDYVTGAIDNAFGTNIGTSFGTPKSSGGGTSSTPNEDTPTVEIPPGAGSSPAALNIPGVISEQPIPAGKTASAPSETTVRESLTRSFQNSANPHPDVKVDTQRLARTATDIQNWNNYSPNQRANASSSLGVDMLQQSGIVTTDRANQIRSAQGSISVLTNEGSTEGQRATAVANLASLSINTPFTGSVSNPQTIGGVSVVGQSEGGFILADGSVVPQQDILQSSNSASTIQAFSVLTSQADKDQKVAALTSIGINAAAANELVDQVTAGNTNAALSVFGTVSNWDKMTPVQQAISVTQTSGTILNSVAANTASSTAQGSGALAYFSGEQAAGFGTTLAQGAGIAAGAYGAYQTWEAIKDAPRSKAATVGPSGGAASGIAIGASVGGPAGAIIGSIVGAGIGSIAGHTGGGKKTGQIMRDGWRSNMESLGVASKNKEGSHTVKLADGSFYDIGKDGGYKLANKGSNIDGGKDRHTFDVDWSNPLTSEAIPDAHIFAIATGLDPTNNKEFDTFDRAVAQGLNAATSNTDSLEGVRGNFRAMLEKIGPVQTVSRIESLRLTNKISEQEYGVYVDRVNKIYGTNFTPTDRKKAQNEMVSLLSQQKNNKEASSLLSFLTNPQELAKAQEQLNARIAAGR